MRLGGEPREQKQQHSRHPEDDQKSAHQCDRIHGSTKKTSRASHTTSRNSSRRRDGGASRSPIGPPPKPEDASAIGHDDENGDALRERPRKWIQDAASRQRNQDD